MTSPSDPPAPDLPRARIRIEAWFAARGWTPFHYQSETWTAYLNGESGLVEAATGMGKTLAVWLGPLQEWLASNPEAQPAADRVRRSAAAPPIQRYG